MMKMKKWNQLIISLMFLLNSGFLLQMIMSGHYGRILVTLSVYLTVWLPAVLRKMLKVKIPDYMEFTYLIFLFFAQFLGSVVNLYNNIYWYDSFTHFVSGILTAVLSIAVLSWLQKYQDKDMVFNILFMIVFSLAIAALWEFFEFTMDCVSGSDTQKVETTQVVDTMKDMIVAFLGATLMGVYYAYEKITNKKQFFYRYEKELGCKHE